LSTVLAINNGVYSSARQPKRQPIHYSCTANNQRHTTTNNIAGCLAQHALRAFLSVKVSFVHGMQHFSYQTLCYQWSKIVGTPTPPHLLQCIVPRVGTYIVIEHLIE
jgi:hypothetical protein